MKTTTVHDQTYEYHSWEDLGKDIFTISRQIMDSGKQFDRVIALAKGGLTFARSLNDFLNIPELSSFQIEFYTGIGATAKTPVITQSLPVSIRNERILLFDDVVDKGDTIKLAIEYLRYHGVAELTSASLIVKPWSTPRPDFSSRETKAWVIFPNESRETIQLLTKMWQKEGDDLIKIKQNLVEIGFPKEEVEYFSKIE
jgi:hypoxanthine phosphoribosyltransferase